MGLAAAAAAASTFSRRPGYGRGEEYRFPTDHEGRNKVPARGPVGAEGLVGPSGEGRNLVPTRVGGREPTSPTTRPNSMAPRNPMAPLYLMSQILRGFQRVKKI